MEAPNASGYAVNREDHLESKSKVFNLMLINFSDLRRDIEVKAEQNSMFSENPAESDLTDSESDDDVPLHLFYESNLGPQGKL